VFRAPQDCDSEELLPVPLQLPPLQTRFVTVRD